MTPSISFVSEVVPDKKLQKTLVYRYYPLSDMREEILKHVKEHLKCELDDYTVEVKIEIDLKMYSKPEKFYYDKPKDDTKNT